MNRLGSGCLEHSNTSIITEDNQEGIRQTKGCVKKRECSQSLGRHQDNREIFRETGGLWGYQCTKHEIKTCYQAHAVIENHREILGILIVPRYTSTARGTEGPQGH